MQKKTLSCYWL